MEHWLLSLLCIQIQPQNGAKSAYNKIFKKIEKKKVIKNDSLKMCIGKTES